MARICVGQLQPRASDTSMGMDWIGIVSGSGLVRNVHAGPGILGPNSRSVPLEWEICPECFQTTPTYLMMIWKVKATLQKITSK